MNDHNYYTLRYFAILREQAGLSDETLHSGAQTPRALYTELSARYDFTLPADKVRAAVNDEFVNMDALLKNNDSIVFIPPVAGG